MPKVAENIILPYIATNSGEDTHTFDISRIFPNQFKLPEDFTVEECVWIPSQFGTSYSEESTYIPQRAFEKEIEGPYLLPNRKFKIKVIIKSIIEGKLSSYKKL